jgi:cardiolipin synthase
MAGGAVTLPGRAHPIAADAVERAFDRAAGGRPIPGNRVHLLFDGPATFDAMIDLVASAKQWVHFDNYIFRADRTGHRFVEALSDQARSGVRVRLSTDWLGSLGTTRRLWRSLEAAGVEVRIFNRPGPFDLASFFSRDHRKLVVADGARAIVAGICIGDDWAGDPARGRLPWRDTALAIEGPAAAAVDQAFATTWGAGGPPIPLDEAVSTVAPVGEASIRVLIGEPARERAYRVSELLLAGAGQRVWITDAYLVAPRRLYRYLIDAASEGVDVRLLVPGTSDLVIVRNLTRFGYRELIRAGVRIFEWKGPMLHAKTVVADSRFVRVGSSNLNHSSLLGNYELDVLVDDAALASEMEAQYRRDLDHSAEVTTRPHRLRPMSRVLPPPLAIERPDRPPPSHRRGSRERRGRSVLALRTLAAGARLALFGPLAIILVVVGILFFVIPAAMGIVVGTISVWLGLVSAAEALRRRVDTPDSGR